VPEGEGNYAPNSSVEVEKEWSHSFARDTAETLGTTFRLHKYNILIKSRS